MSADPNSSASSDAGPEPTARRQAAFDSSAAPADERESARRTILKRVLRELPAETIDALVADGTIARPPGSAPDAVSVFVGSDLPISSKPGSPSRDSRTRWNKPSSAALLAAQANDVATRVLNGDIELDVAARYASTARVAVSAMNIEVQRARAARQTPNLLLDNPVEAAEGE